MALGATKFKSESMFMSNLPILISI